ncbi:MAG: hypothetical protein ACI87Q_002886 [Pseudohongiellaceae bacterium]
MIGGQNSNLKSQISNLKSQIAKHKTDSGRIAKRADLLALRRLRWCGGLLAYPARCQPTTL